MFYPNELAHYKNTNFEHPPGLQTFKAPRPPRKRQKEEAKIFEAMSKFCKYSVHGKQYIYEPGTRPAVRIFWCLIVVTAVAGCIAMYIMLSQRHNEGVLITVVDTSRLPIYSIQFPSVAVCPFNHINWMRYKAAEEKFLPRNASEEAKKIFYDLLTVIERITFTGLTAIDVLLRRNSIPPAIQNIVLYDLAHFMSFRCDEIFVKCVYDESTYDCCKIFVSERTERGICLVFNSLISEESRIKQTASKQQPAMLYPNELARYKNTNFQHPPGLLIFKPLRPPPRTRQLKDKVFEQMLTFCRDGAHGFQHFWEPRNRPAVRIFWLLIVVTAVLGCITMYTMLTQRHSKGVLIAVVETSRLPIYFIPFPAVAVCPFNHINWMRYKAAEEKFLPSNASEEVNKIFYDLLTVIESITFTGLANIQVLMGRKSMPPAIQNIVLYDLAQFMSFRCDELFVKCVYDETDYDCCKIFVSERTERGICLAFNSLISEESRFKKLTDVSYPWRARGGGEGSGLSFNLRYNKSVVRPGSTLPFAFSILIKESGEWSDSLYHILYPNTYNNVMVTPLITETSPNARGIDPQKRNCLYDNEKSKKYDRIEGLPINKLNCQIQCEQKFVMKRCNCTLSMFFPGMPEYPNRECRVSDLGCIYQHRDIFNYLKGPLQDEYINDTRRGMVCDCVNNCMSLLFLVALNSKPMLSENKSIPEIGADVHFSKNTMTKYGTRLQYTYMDLVANFGGVMGLCLGASALSMVEIVYATIRTILVLMVIKWNKKRKLRRVQLVRSVNDIQK